MSTTGARDMRGPVKTEIPEERAGSTDKPLPEAGLLQSHSTVSGSPLQKENITVSKESTGRAVARSSVTP